MIPIPILRTSVPGGNGIVVGSGPGGFSKYVYFEEGAGHPAMATEVAVAVGEIVAVGDGEGVSHGEGVGVGDVTAVAGVLASHASVSKHSPTRRLVDPI
jgi:hypothetical protein